MKNQNQVILKIWNSDNKYKRWKIKHIEGISVHVRNAISCAWYHQNNLTLLQNELNEIYFDSDISNLLKDKGFTLGSLDKWDAEYQAFVLATRRCLDYFSRSIAAYFMTDHNSFRKLPTLLKNVQPETVASAIIEVHSKYVDGFSYVLSTGEIKSTRDLISHYQHVSAGCMNINENGFTMAGGGEKENLRKNGYNWDGGLSNVVTSRANHLNNCIIDMINIFIIKAKKVNGYKKS